MTYVDAGGVHTWYDEHGAGDPLVLLHGGFSDASEFGANIPALIEKPGLCNEVILDFLTREPVPTFMAIRRLPPRPPSG